MAEVTNVSAVRGEFDGEAAGAAPAGPVLPDDVRLYEIDGPFFFGAAEKFKDTIARLEKAPRALVLVLHRVSVLDSTALHALKSVVRRVRHDGTRVCLVGVHAQPMMAMARAGFLDEVGEENLFGSVDLALAALAPAGGGAPSSAVDDPVTTEPIP
jgi:sulfate permease, SulP family